MVIPNLSSKVDCQDIKTYLYLTFQLLPLQPLSPGSVQAPADLPEFDLLDPHQETGPARPMMVKATRRRPPSLIRGSKCVSHDTTVSEFLNLQKNPTSRQFKMTNLNLPPALLDLQMEELERRKAAERVERRNEVLRKKGVDEVGEPIMEDEEEVNGITHVEEVNDSHSIDDDEEIPKLGDDDVYSADLHFGGDVGALSVDGNLSSGDENDSPSYEELVRRKVEQFTLKSQEHMRCSELFKEVAKWHEMIGPRLERLERKKVFDVQTYSARMISQCEQVGGTETTFNHLVMGQQKEEISRHVRIVDLFLLFLIYVSRYFLTTLMLANSGNVEILSDDIQGQGRLILFT